MTAETEGYVDYFEVLGVHEGAKPGEVRNEYRRKMKALVSEIAGRVISQQERNEFLLEMAKLNAALYLLRDQEARDTYWRERQEVIQLESEWREADASGSGNTEALRRRFDTRVRDFLSKYVEELMLTAGQDKEVREASHWDAAHERHAFRVLRHYRHGLYQKILERLPFTEVTRPEIDWDERAKTVAALTARNTEGR